MAGLEELLEGLTEDGLHEGSGGFTLSPGQVWKKLASAVSSPEYFARFCLRWLHLHPCSPAEIQIEQKGNRLLFTARDFSQKEELSYRSAPSLDLAGSDIELSRALVCCELLEAKNVALFVSGVNSAWKAEYDAGAVQWEKLDDSEPGLKFCFDLPRSKQRLLKKAKKIVIDRFSLSPVRLYWDQESLNDSLRLAEPVLIWRRILTDDERRSKMPFRPPAAPEYFVCANHPDSEFVIGLNPSRQSSLNLILGGELFTLERPGFLPGFQIVLRTERVQTDLQGTQLVANENLKQLLQEIREQAYDMILQLYRTENCPKGEVLSDFFTGISAVVLNLLNQNQYVEGHLLATWLEKKLGNSLLAIPVLEQYAFLKAASILAEKANNHRTSNRFLGKAKALIKGPAENRDLEIEAALTDAYLEAKTRRGETDRLHHHTRSQLHLLAVRCKKDSSQEQLFRLYYVLATSFEHLQRENLDLFFEALRLANSTGQRKSKASLLRLLKKSQAKHGLWLNQKEKKQIKELSA